MSTQTAEQAWRPADSLATRLLVMRHQLKISQREAALRSGLSFGEWQSMENGAAARGIDRKVAAIASAFGVDRDWLMWGGALDPSGSGTTRQYLADNAADLIAA
jgi:transcriptional regulator with XRE-family HTH domain